MNPKQNDPMVIMVKVANFAIKKVGTTGLSKKRTYNILASIELDPRPPVEQDLEPIEKLQHIQLTNDEHKGTQMRERTQGCTKTNQYPTYLYAWQSSNMLEIDPNFLCHLVALCPKARPIS
ncbi:hypothetical protein CR513_54037, partial [Mucuna pruriens]